MFYGKKQDYIQQEIKAKHKFPTFEDELTDIINTIFRLQMIYKVDAADLANGNMSKRFPTRMLNGNKF